MTTLTLPDMVSPAQPPDNGVKEFLAFVGVTVVAYVFGVLVLATIFRVVL
jgi:hypothetical protein